MSKVNIYAQALARASSTKSGTELDQFFTNFIDLLKEKKEYKLLPAITREYKALQARSEKGQGTTLMVRDGADGEKYKKELASLDTDFDSGNITVVEDKSLVGGFIAKNSTKMLDRSYKKGLIQMYQRLIK